MKFYGYAAIFHHEDKAGDILLPGCLKLPPVIPLYYQHRPHQICGEITHTIVDSYGLFVQGETSRHINPDITGLSFGYWARHFKPRPAGRYLQTVDLFEVSIVTHPLNERARLKWLSSTPSCSSSARSSPSSPSPLLQWALQSSSPC